MTPYKFQNKYVLLNVGIYSLIKESSEQTEYWLSVQRAMVNDCLIEQVVIVTSLLVAYLGVCHELPTS